MPSVPLVSSREVIKVFEKMGYEMNHQTGSHVILRRREPPHMHLSIPNRRELPRGTLRKLIQDAGLIIEEFTKLL